jgi:hypothetical protein
MKITPPAFTPSTTFSELKNKNSNSPTDDIYDLDLNIDACTSGSKTPDNIQLPISNVCSRICSNREGSFCC